MHAWDTVIEGRDSLNWQIGRHSAKFGGAYQRFIWPMWAYVLSRGAGALSIDRVVAFNLFGRR